MTVVQYEPLTPLPPSEPGAELEPGPTGWVARLRGAAEYAGHIASTEFVPDGLRNKPAAIAAAILYGDELGLSPMQSLQMITVIKGRPSLWAESQRALVLRRGHEMWFEESTATRAVAAGRRAGTDRVGKITWTIDDARRAGLAGSQTWRNYPAEMLRARASAALARAMFPDVISGIPAAEELDDEPENGATGTPGLSQGPEPPADTPPAPAGPKPRKRATTKRQQARPPVPPAPAPDEQTPPADDPPATGARKRQIFALMRDVGMPTGDTERDERLAYVRRVVGRPDLASSNELTQSEAQRLVDDLNELKALPEPERAARFAGTPVSPADGGDSPDDPSPAPEAAGPAAAQETSETAPDAAATADDIPF